MAVKTKTMTKTAYMKMVRELAEKSRKDMIKAAEELWNSGAIDKTQYEPNYILPKLVMVAYASRLKWNWEPPYLTAEQKREIKNFERFM